jgi:ectoine hydroxylase-related dioxygenase (phytanoyl-CoA dioxygenase family)
MSDARITDDQVSQFEREGFLAVPGAISGWIESLRAAMPEFLETAYDPLAGRAREPDMTIRANDGMWRQSEAFARFLFQSPLGEIAASVMRSRQARLYEDLLLYREDHGPGQVDWHRDSPHWPISGRQLSSIWFSLEDVAGDTGAMRFVNGSHRDEDIASSAPGSVAEASSFASRDTTIVPATPGDVTVFHPRVIHTAYGSAPGRPRRSFTIRFTGDDIRFSPQERMYHRWMQTCGLNAGDRLDHPWFPVVNRTPAAA